MLFLKNEAKLIPIFDAIALIVAHIINGQKRAGITGVFNLLRRRKLQDHDVVMR
jgi:hypothetical protein